MLRVSALARALAIVSCVPLVVIGANVAHTALALTPADALSLDALASAASLALLAVAGATLGPAPIATRLGLGAGRLDATRIAIGATGVIAMQKAAVQGDHDARQLDMANAIAREWMERLRRDTMLWTPADVPGQLPPPNLANAALVQLAGGGGQVFPWYLPLTRIAPNGSQADVQSPGFDILGRDLPIANLTMAQQGGGGNDWTTGLMFCTNVRITPLTPNQELLRAEVRVFWPRQMYTAMNPGDCTQNPPASWDLLPPTDQYHFLYLTSAIRQNVAPL